MYNPADNLRLSTITTLLICILFTSCSSSNNEGLQHCVQACQTLLATNCDTRAVDFCQNARENCEVRYNAHPDCRAQLEAMDGCAGKQPAASFVCPLGVINDELRPYHLSEDMCVNAAIELQGCF